MDLGLGKRVALIAASSRGLGFAAARQLALEGAHIVVNGRQEADVVAAAERLSRESGVSPLAVVADVAVREDARRLVQQSVDHFGRLDILITNAGGPPAGTFDTLDEDAWEQAIRLTLLSAVWLIRDALPALRRSDAASILTVTSISVRQPLPNLILSNAIRPAVVGLTKSLSQELGPEGIRVNSILPGWTNTERVQEIMAYRAHASRATAAEEAARIGAEVPLGRMGQPEEFGRVAAFLVSPAASYVSGVMLQVDGGRYAGLL